MDSFSSFVYDGGVEVETLAKKKKKKPVSAGIILFLFLFISGALLYKGLTPDTNPEQEDTTPQYSKDEIPEQYIPIYKEAEADYGVSWEVLAAVHRVETLFSTMESLESPAGAVGHTQFMPCTFVGWSYEECNGKGNIDIADEELTSLDVIEENGGYGVDGNGNGKADPYNLKDAIFSTANYLKANGAADGDLNSALYQYNHADWYVDEVLEFAERYEKNYVAVKQEENNN
ncbi:membrane-bound lytic murein transglycosylase B [Salibacterium salarium]|nr:membrane-bound lytic murein transglycosylase B [Salibacterium salarium]